MSDLCGSPHQLSAADQSKHWSEDLGSLAYYTEKSIKYRKTAMYWRKQCVKLTQDLSKPETTPLSVKSSGALTTPLAGEFEKLVGQKGLSDGRVQPLVRAISRGDQRIEALYREQDLKDHLIEELARDKLKLETQIQEVQVLISKGWQPVSCKPESPSSAKTPHRSDLESNSNQLSVLDNPQIYELREEIQQLDLQIQETRLQVQAIEAETACEECEKVRVQLETLQKWPQRLMEDSRSEYPPLEQKLVDAPNQTLSEALTTLKSGFGIHFLGRTSANPFECSLSENAKVLNFLKTHELTTIFRFGRWRPPSLRARNFQVKLRDIKRIDWGTHSSAFLKNSDQPELDPHQCISLIVQNKTLDFTVDHQETALALVLGLSSLCSGDTQSMETRFLIKKVLCDIQKEEDFRLAELRSN